MFTTYVVQNKKDGTFTMCVDEVSMEIACRELKYKGIGYRADKHEVDLDALAAGKALPKITTVKEWDPE